MNAIFLFDEKREDVNQYLTRAARWYDFIRNGEIIDGVEDVLIERMNREERQELTNYVHSVMEKTINSVADYYIVLWDMFDIMDDFKNQLELEIFMNFHKYNKTKKGKWTEPCTFIAFVHAYVKNPARTVRRFQKGLPKRLDDKRHVVNKATAYAMQTLSKDNYSLTVDEVFECIPEVSKTSLSKGAVLKAMERCACRTKYDEDCEYEVSVDGISIFDPAYAKVLNDFMSSLRPMQRFIFLQNYEYCSEKYVHLTTKELGSVNEFIELCRCDKHGKQHIYCDAHMEYVDEKFIRNQRDSIRNRLRRTILETNMEASDLEGKLEELMMREWEKLESVILASQLSGTTLNIEEKILLDKCRKRLDMEKYGKNKQEEVQDADFY